MIVQTADRGYGLQAASPIASGSLVIEYCGEVISHEECYRRLSSYDLLGVHDFYMMELSSHLMIDARRLGNAARFINHSCAPNCGTQVWAVGSQQRVGIFASRHIEQGEEITYNYRAQTFNARGEHNNVVQACRCGATNCSSFLGEKPTATVAEKGKKKTHTKRKTADSESTERDGSKKSAHAAASAVRSRKRPYQRSGGSAQAVKKTTGFGHGGFTRKLTVSEASHRDEDETEDENDAAANGTPVDTQSRSKGERSAARAANKDTLAPSTSRQPRVRSRRRMEVLLEWRRRWTWISVHPRRSLHPPRPTRRRLCPLRRSKQCASRLKPHSLPPPHFSLPLSRASLLLSTVR